MKESLWAHAFGEQSRFNGANLIPISDMRGAESYGVLEMRHVSSTEGEPVILPSFPRWSHEAGCVSGYEARSEAFSV